MVQNFTGPFVIPAGKNSAGGSLLVMDFARSKQTRALRIHGCPASGCRIQLARWLTGNDPGRRRCCPGGIPGALRFFDNFHGIDGRSWILAIVRNACYTWLRQNRRKPLALEDEMLEVADSRPNPEALHLAEIDRSCCGRLSKTCPTSSAKPSSCANSKDCRTRKSAQSPAHPSERYVASGERAKAEKALEVSRIELQKKLVVRWSAYVWTVRWT